MKQKLSRTICAGLLAAISLLVIGDLSAQEPSSDARAQDRAAITVIVDQWEETWNRHDMQAFGEQFHEDGVWILWTGAVWTGKQAIADGHAAAHETFFRDSVQREQMEELTFVGPDAAVVRFCSTLTGDSRQPDNLVRSRKMLVVTRRDGAWKVSWGQNTRFADATPDAPACAQAR